MSHPRHEWVRQRYQYRCGYCGVSETEVGGELTIDHFRPVSAAGDDSDNNLIYACFRCNTYKGDFFPTSEDLSHGRRLCILSSIPSSNISEKINKRVCWNR